MDLSIVIVSWNTRELLRGCLASLPPATSGLETEILVMDNASGDGSPRMVRDEFPGVRLVETGSNAGFTRANNMALDLAGGDAVVLLNPDTICRPGSLADLHAFLMRTPGAAAAGPTLLDADGRPAITWGNFPAVRYHLLELLGNHRTRLPRAWRKHGFVRIPEPGDGPRDVDYVSGACMMIRRDALEEVGVLDERYFMYFEETDWAWRAKARGLRILYYPGAEVVHLEGRAAKKASAFTLAQFHKSYRLFVRKHYRSGRVDDFRAALFVENALKGLWHGLFAALAPSNSETHRILARNHLAAARLQLQSEIIAEPPGSA